MCSPWSVECVLAAASGDAGSRWRAGTPVRGGERGRRFEVASGANGACAQSCLGAKSRPRTPRRTKRGEVGAGKMETFWTWPHGQCCCRNWRDSLAIWLERGWERRALREPQFSHSTKKALATESDGALTPLLLVRWKFCGRNGVPRRAWGALLGTKGKAPPSKGDLLGTKEKAPLRPS